MVKLIYSQEGRAMSAPPLASEVGNQPLLVLPPELHPSVDHLVTEDDTPVDGIYSEKQHRLLVQSLYGSWTPPGEDKSFVAMTNVGLFFAIDQPPLVPDFLLSLGVRFPKNIREKKYRSYFVWVYGKAPELVLEVVSNKEGGELEKKLPLYAQMGIPLYVVWDPDLLISSVPLQVFTLRFRSYEPSAARWFPEIGLGLKVQNGVIEDFEATWLRWCDERGELIPTGEERAYQERQRADQERQRADRLAAQLRELGKDVPESEG